MIERVRQWLRSLAIKDLEEADYVAHNFHRCPNCGGRMRLRFAGRKRGHYVCINCGMGLDEAQK